MESFSRNTKEELIRKFPEKKCCCISELAAIIHASGSLQLRGKNKMTLKVISDNPSIIRKTHRLLKKLFSVKTNLAMEETERLGKHRKYFLQISGEDMVKKILMEIGIMTKGFALEGGIAPNVVQNNCCRSAFLRGVFLSRGSITDPHKNDYHLELYTENEDFLLGLIYLFNLCGFKVGVGQRKEFFIYIKDVNLIGKFLTFVGAHSAFLHLEEVRVIKEMRAEVNRIVNCETANLEKTVRAAYDQVSLLSEFKDKRDFKSLPDSLKDLACLRLEHPEASLKELGQLSNPPLTKSATNHRMRKLLKIAKHSLKLEGNNFTEMK